MSAQRPTGTKCQPLLKCFGAAGSLTATQVHFPCRQASGDSHVPQLRAAPQSSIMPPQVSPAVSQLVFCGCQVHSNRNRNFTSTQNENRCDQSDPLLNSLQEHCPWMHASFDAHAPQLTDAPQSLVIFPQLIPAEAHVIFCKGSTGEGQLRCESK